MKTSAPLTMPDEHRTLHREENRPENKTYCRDFCQSFQWIYLKSKSFADPGKRSAPVARCLTVVHSDWQAAFCSSSFDSISRHTNFILLYRTILLSVTLVDLIYGITQTDPIFEWMIYYTHLTLLVTFFAVGFQFLITSRIKFYHGDRIVPPPYFQSIHLNLLLISLGSGVAVCVIYWLFIYHPHSSLNMPKTIFDHGLLWLLLFVDVFFFTRLPIYMIDFIPLMITSFIYGLFTLSIYFFQAKFSRKRVGYVYKAFDFTAAPLRSTLVLAVFVVLAPILIVFLLWNCFRLRRSIDVQIPKARDDSDLNIDL